MFIESANTKIEVGLLSSSCFKEVSCITSICTAPSMLLASASPSRVSRVRSNFCLNHISAAAARRFAICVALAAQLRNNEESALHHVCEQQCVPLYSFQYRRLYHRPQNCEENKVRIDYTINGKFDCKYLLSGHGRV